MVLEVTGHGDLEERCLVKKREDNAGGAIGGGSFLNEKGCLVSGEEDRGSCLEVLGEKPRGRCLESSSGGKNPQSASGFLTRGC